MDDTYFVIPLWADLTAVAVGGIQGALFASGFQGKRRLDWLGVAIIGVVMGMGGGIIRDLLVNVTPATMLSNWYLVTATAASLIGMLLAGTFQRLNRFIVGLDAIAIGMFGALGTTKALGVGMPVIPSIFVGVSAAVGGGMLRDVLMGLPVAVMHVGSLYAVAAGAGCTALVIASSLGLSVGWAGVLCVVVTAVIRILAVVFDLSLPEQRRLFLRRLAAERRRSASGPATPA